MSISCHVTWSIHVVLPGATCSLKIVKIFSTTSRLTRYPLDHLVKPLLLAAHSFNTWGTALLVVAPPIMRSSCTLLHAALTSMIDLEHPAEVSTWHSPRDGSSAMFESLGTLDIQALKDN